MTIDILFLSFKPETICFRPGAAQNVIGLTTRFQMNTTDPILIYSIEPNRKNNSSSREPSIFLCRDKKYQNTQSTTDTDFPCHCPTVGERFTVNNNSHYKSTISTVLKLSNENLMCTNYSHHNLNASIRLLIPQDEKEKQFESSRSILLTLSQFYKQDNLIDIVRFLVGIDKNEIDVNAKDQQYNRGALHLLSHYYKEENLIDVIRFLIEKGIDVNAKDKNNWSALHLICRDYRGKNLVEIVRLLIAKGIDVKAKDNFNWTALHFLFYEFKGSKLFDIVELLIEKGIEVGAQIKNDNRNALHLLSRYYSGDKLLEIVRLLIDNGIEVNQTDDYNENSLIILCRWSQSDKIFEVAKLLISKGINVEQKDINERNASYYINQRSNDQIANKSQILELLLRHSSG